MSVALIALFSHFLKVLGLFDILKMLKSQHNRNDKLIFSLNSMIFYTFEIVNSIAGISLNVHKFSIFWRLL